jgi:hypothetical protein
LIPVELVSNAVWLVMVTRTTSFGSFSTRAAPVLISWARFFSRSRFWSSM